MLAIGALAALFAAFQAWNNSREIVSVREDLTASIAAVREDLLRRLGGAPDPEPERAGPCSGPALRGRHRPRGRPP